MVSIGDGDTIRVSDGHMKVTVRLACIDAPEKAQSPVGDMAHKGLADLIPAGSKISLEEKGKDRYGRTIGIVYSEERDINLLMVRSGLAFAYKRYLKPCNAREYIEAETQARKHKEGIWGVNWKTEEPWTFRANRKTSASKAHEGTRDGKTCKEIKDWETAQRMLEAGLTSLDRDKDGIACEGLLKRRLPK